MKGSEVIKLIRDTLSVEPGASFLKQLEAEISGPMYDPDPNKVYARVGVHDLISRWKIILTLDDKQLDELIKREQDELGENNV